MNKEIQKSFANYCEWQIEMQKIHCLFQRKMEFLSKVRDHLYPRYNSITLWIMAEKREASLKGKITKILNERHNVKQNKLR